MSLLWYAIVLTYYSMCLHSPIYDHCTILATNIHFAYPLRIGILCFTGIIIIICSLGKSLFRDF